MENKKCIICYTEIPAVDLSIKKANLKEDSVLNRQLIVIFLLRKFFKTPQDTCLEFLKKYGNPCQWIDWCDSCSFLVEKAKCIMDQITLLRKQVDFLQVELKNAVFEKQFQETPRDKIGFGWGATEVIRANFFNNNSQLDRHDLEDSVTEVKIESFDCDDIFDGGQNHSDDIPTSGILEGHPESKVSTTSTVKLTKERNQPNFTEADDNLDSISASENEDISNDDDEDADYCGSKDNSESEDKVEKRRSCVSKYRKCLKKKQKNFKCEKCTKAYTILSRLKDHFVATHGDLPITCEMCKEKMIDDSELRKHNDRFHKISDRSFSCPKCGKTFGAQDTLRKHCQKKHSGELDDILPRKRANPRAASLENSTPCKICGKQFLLTTLRAHCRKYHPENFSEMFSKKDVPCVCDVCKVKLSSQSRLETHFRKKHPEDFKYKYRDQSVSHTCPHCQFKTVNEKYLQFHIAKHASPNFPENGENISGKCGPLKQGSCPLTINTNQLAVKKNFICEMCSIPCKTLVTLKYHFVHVHGELPFSCELCFSKMVNEDELKMHNEKFHAKAIKFSCPKCPSISYRKSSSIKRHFELEHPTESEGIQIPRKKAPPRVPTAEEFVSCETCGKVCAHSGALRQHRRKFHPDEHAQLILNRNEKSCDICNTKFVTKRDLKSHFEKDHPEEFKSRYYTEVPRNVYYYCNLCPFKSKGKGYLQEHIKRHDSDRPYICDLCGTTFRSGQMLRYHRHSKHFEELGLDPYKCQQCGKMFETPGYLQTHIKEHLGQFRHRCPLCSKGFSIKSSLRLHVLRHKGEKPELCAQCGKSFLTNYALQGHIKRVHSNQKPFHCPKCSKSFKDRSALRRHDQGVHSDGTKPHECQICHKKFPVRNYLYIHMRSHTKKGGVVGKYPEKDKSKD